MNNILEKLKQNKILNIFLQSPLSKYFSYIALFILIGGIFLTVRELRNQQELRGRAASFPNGIDLTLSSSKSTFQPGDIIDVNVLVDTKNLTLSAIDFTIKFATSDLQVLELKNGPFLYGSQAGTLTIVPGSPTAYGSIDNTSTNGTAQMVLLSGSPLDPPERQARKGTGILATMKVQVKSSSAANSLSLNFDPVLTDAKALEQQRDPNVPGSTAPNVIDVLTGITFTLGTGTANADLSFQPSAATVAPGQQFSVDVLMNTNGAQVTSSEIHLIYPESLLTLNTTTLPPVPGPFMPVLVTQDNNLGPGHAMISVGASSGTDGVTGTGIIARFTFNAKTTLSTAQLQFLRDDVQTQPPVSGTKVTVFGDLTNNRVGATPPTSITIAAISQTPTTTVVPTNTPIPTNTPTPTITPVPLLFQANLNSGSEVPPTSSNATGIGTVLLRDATNIFVSLSLTGVTGQISAHIHGPAPEGSNAGIIVTLPTGSFSNFDTALTPAQVQNLKDGLLYMNVHTSDNPNGDIRGQLLLTDGNPSNTPTPTPQPQPTNTPVPTATVPPQATALRFAIAMPAIGTLNAGDNPTPVRPSRVVSVEVLSGTTLVKAVSGTLTYGSSVYTGTVDLGSGISAGTYTVKVNFDNTLKTSRTGVGVVLNQTVNVGSQASPVTVVTGDLNSDNKLDVYDYNIIISCFGTTVVNGQTVPRKDQPSCGGEGDTADLNDNGAVDGPDYNLFLTQIKIKPQGD